MVLYSIFCSSVLLGISIYGQITSCRNDVPKAVHCQMNVDIIWCRTLSVAALCSQNCAAPVHSVVHCMLPDNSPLYTTAIWEYGSYVNLSVVADKFRFCNRRTAGWFAKQFRQKKPALFSLSLSAVSAWYAILLCWLMVYRYIRQRSLRGNEIVGLCCVVTTVVS